MMKRMLFCDVHFIFVIPEQELRAVTDRRAMMILTFRHICGLFNEEFLKRQTQNIIGTTISTSELIGTV